MPNIALIAGNLVSDSGLDSSTINAQNYSRKHSARDFPNGTLIETTIDYSVTNGDPFVLEITGNSYGALVPFNMAYQGYIYNNTTINHGGISTGAAITGMSLFNYNGKLCFWFPSQAYWQGFNIYVYIADTGFRENKVTNITNVAKPAGITKEISMTFQHLIRAASASVGTTNYVAKFTGNVAVGDSQIFDNGTNVGIGTASPSYKFHVVSSDTTVGAFRNSSAANSQLLIGNTAGDLSIRTLSTGDGYIFSDTGKYLDFGTNASFRMRITSAGNVGIGTTSPTSKLQIESSSATAYDSTNILAVDPIMYVFNNNNTDAAITTTLRLDAGTFGANSVATISSVRTGAASAALTFGTRNAGGSVTEKMRITSGGNVGIGTASPSIYGGWTGLDIRGTNGGHLIVGNTAATNRGEIFTDGNGFNISAQTNNALIIKTNDAERMRITAAGNVGINNQSPTAKLHINGDNNQLILNTTGTWSATYYHINGADRAAFYVNNTETHIEGRGTAGLFFGGAAVSNHMRIDSTGNVGIGTTSPAARLDVFTTSTNGIDLRNAPTTLGDQTSKNSPRLRLVSSRYEGGNVDAPFSLQNVRTGSPTNDQRLAITNFGDVEVMSITNIGNVGIGTVTPGAKLEVNLASGVNIITARGPEYAQVRHTDGVRTFFTQVYDNVGFMGMESNSPLAIGTNNTERLRITSTGNVGIGTASPQQTLHVNTSTGGYLQLSRTAQGGTTSPFGGIYFGDGTTFQEAAILSYADGNLVSGDLQFYTRAAAGSLLERLRITSSGNVGIGTASPAYKLDVNGGTRVTGRLTITGNDTLAQSMARAGTSAFASEIYNSGGDNSWLIWGVESSLGGVIFPGSTAYAAVIGQFRNTPLEFFTNNTIRGSFSAAGAFRVNNLAGTGSRIVVADANGVLSTTATAPVTGTGTAGYITRWTGTSTQGVSQIFDNGTRIGIGTVSPAARLDIRGTGVQDLYLISTTGSNQENTIQSYFNNGGGWSDLSTKSQNLLFYTGPSGGPTVERLRITSGGNVGIGLVPQGQSGFKTLEVGGTGVSGLIDIYQGTTRQLRLYNSGPDTYLANVASGGSMLFRTTTSGGTQNNNIIIFANGRVGINTTTDAGDYKLQVAGAIYVNNPSSVALQIGGGQAIRTTGALYIDYGTAGSGDLVFRGGSGFASVMTLTNGGNVGIGTASPTGFSDRILNIYGSTSAELHLTTAGTGTLNSDGFIVSVRDSDGLAQVMQRENAALLLGTNDTERLRITSDGDILHRGTYNPLSAANRGNIMLNGSASNIIGFSNNSALRGYIFHTDSDFQFYNNTTGGRVGLYTEATARLWIQANGRVGINTTTDAGYQLDVNGSFRASGVIRSAAAVGVTTGFFQLDHPGVQTWKLGVFTDNTSTFSIGNDNGGTFASRYLNITNSGNVGIGTASPSYKMTVKAATDYNIGIGLLGSYASINVLNDASSAYKELRIDASTVYQNAYSGGKTILNTGSDVGDYKLQVAGNIYNTGSAVFAATGGNIGIGTTSPAQKVEIYNGALLINRPSLGNDASHTMFRTQVGTDATLGQLYFLMTSRPSATGSNRYVEMFAGDNVGYRNITFPYANVGIGTTSPVSRLQVQGAQQNAAQTVIRFAANNASGQIKALDLQINAGSNLAVFNTAYAGSAMGIDFADAGTSRMRIDTVGNVGIGTDSPSHKLTLFRSGTAPSFISFRNGNTTSGDITIGASAGGDLYITNPNSTSISFFTSSSNPMNLTSGGSVLIGTVSDLGASYRLQVTGNTYQTGYAQINGVSNFPSVYVSSHIITGSSSQAVLSLGATLNTTGAPSIIYADISDTASGAETNFMQFVNGSTKFRVTKQGDIQTAAPAGGTAKKWKLGSVVTTTVTMVTSQYVEVEIDGTFYRLALVSPA